MATAVDTGARPRALVADMLRRHQGRLALGSVLGLAMMLVGAALPVVLGWSLDWVVDVSADGTTAVELDRLWIAGAVLAAAVLGFALFAVAQEWVMVGIYVSGRLSIQQRITARAFDRAGGVRESSGTLLSLSVNDARSIGDVAQLIAVVPGAAVTFIIIAGSLIVSDPLLGSVATVSAIAATIGIAPLAKPFAAKSAVERGRLAEATAALTDSMVGLGQAKGLRAEPTLRRWFRARSGVVRSSAVAVAKARATIFAATMASPVVVLVPVMWLAGRQVVGGSMTAGEFVALIGLVMFMQGPVQSLGQAVQWWAAANASAERVVAVVDAPAGVGSGDRAVAWSGVERIETHGLSADGGEPVDLVMPIGGVVAIDVGDAARAQAVAEVLVRRRAPVSGTVEIIAPDVTIDLARWSLVDAAAVIDVDGSHPWLPSGSLRRALRLANPAADDDACRAALAAAGAEDLADRSDGLDRPIGERGGLLSGGQRQRLAVAQAAVCDAEVVVVVEPTSALDTVTEQRVAQRFTGARRGRPTLIFTSSPAVQACCDHVVRPGHAPAMTGSGS